MKLSDVVGHAGLAFYTEVALVLFFIVFVAVLWRTWSPSRRAELEAQARMPLESDTPPREETGPVQGATATRSQGATATRSQGATATRSQGATATPSQGATATPSQAAPAAPSKGAER